MIAECWLDESYDEANQAYDKITPILQELQKAAFEELGDLPPGWTDRPMDEATRDYCNRLVSVLAELEGRRRMTDGWPLDLKFFV